MTEQLKKKLQVVKTDKLKVFLHFLLIFDKYICKFYMMYFHYSERK